MEKFQGTAKDTFEIDKGKGVKDGGFNARYKSALNAMAKQKMLLGRVLDTKYSKQYGSTWKKDFKVLKQKWTNPQNVSDTSAANDDAGKPETAADSDAIGE